MFQYMDKEIWTRQESFFDFVSHWPSAMTKSEIIGPDMLTFSRKRYNFATE